jgi:Uma2 family endonuclease
MGAAAARTLLSVEDYLALQAASPLAKFEYYYGEVYDMAGASPDHNVIATNISTALSVALRDTPCLVFNSDQRVALDPQGHFGYPDVSVSCDPRYDGATLLTPLVVVEVLSDDTETYDRGRKFEQYRRHSPLEAYVLVSQHAPHVECYTRGPDDAWTLTEAHGLDGALALPPLDLTLALGDVYRKVPFSAAAPPFPRAPRT